MPCLKVCINILIFSGFNRYNSVWNLAEKIKELAKVPETELVRVPETEQVVPKDGDNEEKERYERCMNVYSK